MGMMILTKLRDTSGVRPNSLTRGILLAGCILGSYAHGSSDAVLSNRSETLHAKSIRRRLPKGVKKEQLPKRLEDRITGGLEPKFSVTLTNPESDSDTLSSKIGSLFRKTPPSKVYVMEKSSD